MVVEGTSKPPPYSESSSANKDITPAEKDKPVDPPADKSDQLSPPPPPPPPTTEMKEKKDKSNEDIEVVIDANHPLAKSKTEDVEFITMSTFKQKFGKVDSWFKELFGPGSLFFDDKESDSIEAFLILGNNTRLKIPFGHRRLKFGMKRVMKAKKTSTLDDYAALPKHLHAAIQNSLKGAKMTDSRERVVVCFDVLKLGEKHEDQHLLAFFAMNGAPLEPVHFKDAVGRKFLVPYHLVQTWPVSLPASNPCLFTDRS